MVIISSILERDNIFEDKIWNTAVVIDNYGCILGKHRANHISRIEMANEPTYYNEGDTGHPVFKVRFFILDCIEPLVCLLKELNLNTKTNGFFAFFCFCYLSVSFPQHLSCCLPLALMSVILFCLSKIPLLLPL